MPTAEAAVAWESECSEIETTKWATPVPAKSAEDKNSELKSEIERATKMLALGDDWDEEGGLLYTKETLDRAIAFLSSHSSYLYRLCGIHLPVPILGVGPNGSVDIHWKRPTWELLVNIPADANQMAAFYGDDYGNQEIKGNLDPEIFNVGIVEWLMH